MLIMPQRHAYLIMAHNEFDILAELLRDIDDERNDIYLHIDKKVPSFCEEKVRNMVLRGGLYFVPRMNVNWSGYTQIKCEMLLLEEAQKHSKYDYYHMLTGVNFPLKSQDYIHKFFEDNNGKEFIGFDTTSDYSARLRYIYLFNEIGKANTSFKKKLYNIRSYFVSLQKMVGFQRKCTKNLIIKKGLVYWSITNNAANYILCNKKYIEKLCKHSVCGDEVFVQTIIGMSPLKINVYNCKNEFDGCQREVPWHFEKENGRPENVFIKKDIDYLLQSDKIFAMKFSGKEGLEIIKEIKKLRKK